MEAPTFHPCILEGSEDFSGEGRVDLFCNTCMKIVEDVSGLSPEEILSKTISHRQYMRTQESLRGQ